MARAGSGKRALLFLALSVSVVLIAASIIVISAFLSRKPDWKTNRTLVMMEIKKHPDRGILYCYLGRISFGEARYNEAIKDMEEALNKKLSASEKAEVYNELGNCYNKKNRINKAIDYYRKAAVATADNAAVINSLGQIYFNGRDFEKARQCFEMAAAGHPGAGEYYRNLANAYLMLDDTRKAREYWEKSLKINRDQPDVRELLSRYER